MVRSRGLPVGVLSNSWGSGADGYDAYDGHDLDERFDAVVISDEVGTSKPDEDTAESGVAEIAALLGF